MIPPLLLAHLAATLLMTGVIWVVQIVVYPQFIHSGPHLADAPAMVREHGRRIVPVVTAPMLLELATAVVLLVPGWRPAELPAWAAWVGAGLVAALWVVTTFVSVPCHAALSARWDAAVAARLVRTNWWRTALWTSRAALLLAVLWP